MPSSCVSRPFLSRFECQRETIESHPPKRVSPLINSEHPPHFEHVLDASTQFYLLRSIELPLCPIMVRRRRTILLRRESVLADRPKVKRRGDLAMFRPSMHVSSRRSFLRRRKFKFDRHDQPAQRKPDRCLRSARRQWDRILCVPTGPPAKRVRLRRPVAQRLYLW